MSTLVFEREEEGGRWGRLPWGRQEPWRVWRDEGVQEKQFDGSESLVVGEITSEEVKKKEPSLEYRENRERLVWWVVHPPQAHRHRERKTKVRK